MKRQPTEWDEIFGNHTYRKGLVNMPKIEETPKIQLKKPTHNPVKNGQMA